jgi:hypothetical protein
VDRRHEICDGGSVNLRVVGAGLPRTGTTSLKTALEQLLGGPCYHMTVLPDHPVDLGADWRNALAGEPADWDRIYAGYVAAVDWPTSLFWAPLSRLNPDALVLLSLRESAEVWWDSFDATILHDLRPVFDDGDGGDAVGQFERFMGTSDLNDRNAAVRAYERHNAHVLATVPAERLLIWQPTEGWEPLCRALDLPVPDEPFPWHNDRGTWSATS